MTEKLKPCPFCGGEAEFNSDEFGEGVYCKSCGATLRNGVYGEYGRKLASADWNSRPIEDEHASENKRLREALELIAKAKFYFARGEEEKQIRRVCEIAEDALKGCSE